MLVVPTALEGIVQVGTCRVPMVDSGIVQRGADVCWWEMLHGIMRVGDDPLAPGRAVAAGG